jgi:hypothetical protein
MLRVIPDLEQVARVVRRDVCPHCDRRTAGADEVGSRACEANCPVFAHLPHFRRVALSIDPMIASRPRAVHDAVADACHRDPPGADSPLRRHPRRVARAILAAVGES